MACLIAAGKFSAEIFFIVGPHRKANAESATTVKLAILNRFRIVNLLGWKVHRAVDDPTMDLPDAAGHTIRAFR